ncbi:MAG: hypothetical protein LBI36_03420 [Oscillospiraceae bacterium]|jgi:hypothetical protein|nr:hypothetical protein [Oscillospiraceae bacterium]
MSGEMRGGIYSFGIVRLARLSGELAVALLKADGVHAKTLSKSILNLGKERKERRRSDLDFEIAAEAAKLWIVANEENRRVDALIEEILKERQEDMSRAREQLREDADRAAYTGELNRARERINLFITEKAEEISRGFADKINAEADNFKYKAAVRREKLLSEALALSNDASERNDFVKNAAVKIIGEAKAFYDDLKKHYDFAESDLFQKHLESAERQLGLGNGEAAVIAAFDAANEAALLIARTEARLAPSETMYSLCRAALSECEELLLSGRKVEIKDAPIVKPENVREESDVYALDMAEFMDGEYERLLGKVEALGKRLEKPVYMFADDELSDIRVDTDKLFGEINEAFLKGIEMVNNAFLRDYMRECVASAIEGCGLREVDSTEDCALNESVQRFVNRDTGEEIRVRLTPRFDENGVLQTEMSVLNEADDYGTRECERRRDKYRDVILEKMGSSETLRSEGMEARLCCEEETRSRSYRKVAL